MPEEMMLYTKDKIAIRRMEAADLPALATAEDDFSDSSRAYFERQLRWQQNGESTALLALFEGQIAGYIFLFPTCRWGGLRDLGLPSMADLFVLEQYRKNGIGTALLDVAEGLAAQFSDQIYLNVPVNSAHGAAQRLYVKRGYVPDGNGLYCDADGNGLCTVCPPDATFVNDDDMTLGMVKALR